MFPPSDRLTSEGILKLFWQEQRGNKDHPPLEPALLQVLSIERQELFNMMLMVLSDGFVKIKVRVTGNARMLAEQNTLEKFDVVAVPLSAVRLTGSSPTDLRGNPWLQALIISDMVVRVKGVCQAIGRPIDLDEFKENNGNPHGNSLIERPKPVVDIIAQDRTEQFKPNENIVDVQPEKEKVSAAIAAENGDRQAMAPPTEDDLELLELLEEEIGRTRLQQICYESPSALEGHSVPRRVNYKGRVNFLSALNQKKKTYFNFSLVNRNKEFIDVACFGYDAPRFYKQLQVGHQYRLKNITCRRNNLHPEKLQLVLERESEIEECKNELIELEVSNFHDAKEHGQSNINILAKVRGISQRERNRTVQLVDNHDDFITLVLQETVWQEHRNKPIEIGLSYLFLNLRKVTSKLDRQELNSSRNTEIIPEEEARKRYKFDAPAEEQQENGKTDKSHHSMRPINLATLKDVASCQKDRTAFQVKALLTFPELQMFTLRHLFRVRCVLCKSDPFDLSRTNCQNCGADLDVKFNVRCEIEDQFETLSADLSTFVIEKELNLPAVDALTMFHNSQAELVKKFRQLEYRQLLLKVQVNIATGNRRYIKVSMILTEERGQVEHCMQIVRANLEQLNRDK